MYYDPINYGPEPSLGAPSFVFIMMMGFFILLGVAFTIFFIISLWKIFEKANKPGWAAIIPIYNIIILLQIANIPVWTIVLPFIPGINIIAGPVLNILLGLQISKAFGKDELYAVGLILLPIVFYPLLAFNKDEYREVKPLF